MGADMACNLSAPAGIDAVPGRMQGGSGSWNRLRFGRKRTVSTATSDLCESLVDDLFQADDPAGEGVDKVPVEKIDK